MKRCLKKFRCENGLLPQVGSGRGANPTGDENVKIAAFAELEYVHRVGRKKKAPPPDIPSSGYVRRGGFQCIQCVSVTPYGTSYSRSSGKPKTNKLCEGANREVEQSAERERGGATGKKSADHGHGLYSFSPDTEFLGASLSRTTRSP